MLCHLCFSFTDYILHGNLGDIDHWRPDEPNDYEAAKKSSARPQIVQSSSTSREYRRPCIFMHYPSSSRLESSALEGCKLCTLISQTAYTGGRSSRNRIWRDPPIRFILTAQTHNALKQFLVCISHGVQSKTVGVQRRLEYYQSSTSPNTLLSPDERRETFLSPKSDGCMALARQWIQDCRTSHTNCSYVTPLLPSRVVYVDPDESKPLRLHISSGGERAPFTSLSHCWGPKVISDKVIRTKIANIVGFESRISFEELPKNFQDAVFVTRKLGFCYLWIDSLCIIQDSVEDWEKEAAKMCNIYEESVVTISALSSPDCNAGFLQDRRTPGEPSTSILLDTFENERLAVRVVPHDFGIQFDKDLPGVVRVPLWNRAWVLQERCLSSRILHFGQDQMYWECKSVMRHEEGPQNLRAPNGAWVGPGCFSPKIPKSTDVALQRWYRMLGDYSARLMSFEGDRLPALSGLAARFQQLYAGSYLAGIWGNDVIRGLLWHCARPNQNHHSGARGERQATLAAEVASKRADVQSINDRADQKLRLPSWTWAAVGRPIIYDELYGKTSSQFKPCPGLRIISAEVFHGSSNPLMGRVQGGTIHLSGLSVKRTITPTINDQNGPRAHVGDITGNVKTKSSSKTSGFVLLDYTGDDPQESVLLYIAQFTEKNGFTWDYWLALVKEPEQEAFYSRVGLLRLRNDKGEGFHTKLLEECSEIALYIV